MWIASIDNGSVTYISSGIDTDRARCALTYGNNICEFSICQPMVFDYRFILDKRQHSIAATEVENAYLGEDIK